MDPWQLFLETELLRKNWTDSRNIAIMVEEKDLAPHLKDGRLCETHLQENTIWKPITWLTWVPRDREKLS